MSKHVTYSQKDDIHILRWHSANQESVDSWLKWMSRIRAYEGRLGHILIDFSQVELPPVRYMSMQVRRWLTQHVPTKPGATIAVVYPASQMPFLIVARSYSMTLRRGRPVKLEFFSSDEMDDAYQWLSLHKRDHAETE